MLSHRDPALTLPPSFKFDGVDKPPCSLRSLEEFEEGFRLYTVESITDSIGSTTFAVISLPLILT